MREGGRVLGGNVANNGISRNKAGRCYKAEHKEMEEKG